MFDETKGEKDDFEQKTSSLSSNWIKIPIRREVLSTNSSRIDVKYHERAWIPLVPQLKLAMSAKEREPKSSNLFWKLLQPPLHLTTIHQSTSFSFC